MTQFRVFVSALLALAAFGASAQGWPSRPVHVVVPYPAGGPNDIIVRMVGKRLGETLGEPIVVENRPGAGGNIGTDSVAKSAPDGYTLVSVGPGALIINPLLGKVPYDTMRDFAPVSLVVNNTTVLVVRPDLPVKNAKDLAEMAKAKPATYAFASTGVGSMPHLALELFQTAANVKFVHVPYRGAAPALTDLLGGQVTALFADAPVLMSQIEAGKLKPLGAASDERNPMLPNVPTLREQGYADTKADNWYGLLAPAKTPPAVIPKLNQAVRTAVSDPVVHEKLVKSGAVPAPTSPEEFGQLLKSEIARWGKVIREKGIKEE